VTGPNGGGVAEEGAGEAACGAADGGLVGGEGTGVALTFLHSRQAPGRVGCCRAMGACWAYTGAKAHVGLVVNSTASAV
jgi:hypothetical protein